MFIWIFCLHQAPQAWWTKYQTVVSTIGKLEWTEFNIDSSDSIAPPQILIQTKLLSFIKNQFVFRRLSVQDDLKEIRTPNQKSSFPVTIN
jgi:hypothetical protein